MKLVELSEKSGVQLATLSRMEHGKMTGTVESHIQIARALGVDVTDLYRDLSREGADAEVMTERSIKDVFVHTQKAASEILAHNVSRKKMMPTLLKLEPAGRIAKEQAPWGTEKFLYVIDGRVDVHIREKIFPLKKHHSLYFDAGLEHWLENPGKAPAKALCVSTPVAL